MSHPILQAPTATTMTLRALARFPDRQAFVWDGGSLTYAATLRLIGWLQAAMAASGLRKGQTMACLAANSAETWCAGVAAPASCVGASDISSEASVDMEMSTPPSSANQMSSAFTRAT